MCVCACVRVCVCACARVRVCACVCVTAICCLQNLPSEVQNCLLLAILISRLMAAHHCSSPAFLCGDEYIIMVGGS